MLRKFPQILGSIADRASTLHAALCLSALLCSGCGRGPGSTPSSRQPVALLQAIDVSQREPDTLLRYASQSYRLQRSLEDGDILRVSVFAHELDPVFEGPRIPSRNEFNSSIGPFLDRTRVGLNTPRTRTDVALEKIGEQAANFSRPIVVAVLTDGGMEGRDPDALARLSRAVRRLAANRHVKAVVMAGVLPEWRLRWESWLSPLGQRAIVRGTTDAEDALRSGLMLAQGGAR